MTLRLILELPAIAVEVTLEQLAALEKLLPVVMERKAVVHGTKPGARPKLTDDDRLIREAGSALSKEIIGHELAAVRIELPPTSNRPAAVSPDFYTGDPVPPGIAAEAKFLEDRERARKRQEKLSFQKKTYPCARPACDRSFNRPNELAIHEAWHKRQAAP